jgi:hypothetical protein
MQGNGITPFFIDFINKYYYTLSSNLEQLIRENHHATI